MSAFCYTVSSDGQIEVAQSSFSNKNGIYKVAMLSKDDTRLSIRLNLAKNGQKTGVPQC
jgi:hypothetical protein